MKRRGGVNGEGGVAGTGYMHVFCLGKIQMIACEFFHVVCRLVGVLILLHCASLFLLDFSPSFYDLISRPPSCFLCFCAIHC